MHRSIEMALVASCHGADELLTIIRGATDKGWVLGSDRLRIQIEAMTARRAAPLPKGRPKKIDSDP
jgi:hypothetical protein